ncbi:hypothetical protein [Paenibacillus naphthalenovorans]|uniref:hypothetical protein n=1 Tax=Paenibacillus naphthalenovorans TaxID=162209 RepID=UPI003AAEE558
MKLLGYIRTIRAVLPHYQERRQGSIVNIVGGAGRTPLLCSFPVERPTPRC